MSVNKMVIDGVYETSKMRVEIHDDIVIKTFKKARNSTQRYTREKKALHLLLGQKGFPQIIEYDDALQSIVMSRLKGERPETLSELQAGQLRALVHVLNETGVARHAMPIRDFIVDKDGNLGMVDFERVTFRAFRYSPIWNLALKVNQYNLLKLINVYQPQALSAPESEHFYKLLRMRNSLTKLKPLRNSLRNFWSYGKVVSMKKTLS
ncbi:hypothetical protein L2735_11170 [Shewanella olleyana]|uniref:hypothetical protein n=1 Tax=Shewanella olleyana TaxID=135626 RepID=UPI00200CC83E|nr:hypothetical protein [Shewanella olleyana]MCL1067366.1 hypothetical protein [Shewanella olleyana]